MSVIHPGLCQIIRQFPVQKDIVRCLYWSNRAFQSVCHDYHQCENALRYWKHSGDERAQELYHEYAELLKSLEQEIAGFLGRERRADTDRQGRHD